jgi:hypothetical protein
MEINEDQYRGGGATKQLFRWLLKKNKGQKQNSAKQDQTLPEADPK